MVGESLHITGPDRHTFITSSEKSIRAPKTITLPHANTLKNHSFSLIELELEPEGMPFPDTGVVFFTTGVFSAVAGVIPSEVSAGCGNGMGLLTGVSAAITAAVDIVGWRGCASILLSLLLLLLLLLCSLSSPSLSAKEFEFCSMGGTTASGGG